MNLGVPSVHQEGDGHYDESKVETRRATQSMGIQNAEQPRDAGTSGPLVQQPSLFLALRMKGDLSTTFF